MPLITSGRYAVVASSLALVVALGGTGYAATVITGKQIKNNSITGKDIKESSLKQVPSAAKADSATNATNAATATNANHAGSADTAANATKVDGASIVKVQYRSTSSSPTTIANVGGLVISATCTGSYPALTAATTKTRSSIYSIYIDDESDTTYGDDEESQYFEPGVDSDLLGGATTSATDPGVLTFEYDNPDGTVITGTLATDAYNDQSVTPLCAVTGNLVVNQ